MSDGLQIFVAVIVMLAFVLGIRIGRNAERDKKVAGYVKKYDTVDAIVDDLTPKE